MSKGLNNQIFFISLEKNNVYNVEHSYLLENLQNNKYVREVGLIVKKGKGFR